MRQISKAVKSKRPRMQMPTKAVRSSAPAGPTAGQNRGVFDPEEQDFEDFEQLAQMLLVRIGDDNELEAKPKEFSTGSFGWGANASQTIELAKGGEVEVVISVNITVKGSKKSKSLEKDDRTEEVATATPTATSGRAKKRKASEDSAEEGEGGSPREQDEET